MLCTVRLLMSVGNPRHTPFYAHLHVVGSSRVYWEGEGLVR